MIGGRAPDGPGYFYPPTVLVDVPRDAQVLHEEVFGPVAPVVRFDDEDEAAAPGQRHRPRTGQPTSTPATSPAACGSPERLESGMVGLNRGLVSDPAAPFGGTKQSGLGREGGTEGLLEFMEAQYIATSW